MFSKPEICLINTADKVLHVLRKSYSEIYNGNFGNLIETKLLHYYESCKIMVDYTLSNNLHEYDVFIIDMTRDVIIPYQIEEHKMRGKAKDYIGVLCQHPQAIFDGRPLVSKEFFADFIWQEEKKLYIIFASKSETINYEFADFSNNGQRVIESYDVNNYDFIGDNIRRTNKYGKEINVLDSDFKQIFKKYLSNSKYHLIFDVPDLPSYTPLLENRKNEIVGYLRKINSSFLFVLPDFDEKEKFLEKFINHSLPSFVPDFFPQNTEAHWLASDDFTLPGIAELQNKKVKLVEEVEYQLKEIDIEIHNKMIEFEFLHNLIKETSDALVNAVEKFFKYIDFEEILNVDEIDEGVLKEEDLRINDNGKLLIIEVKGINGTSTDADCSQVSKVRYRKMKELKRTDINALYIVNHQRFLPPMDRKNPPFNEVQIKDAVNDDRGLLTTWQLYKAYEYIQKGILNKLDVKSQIFQLGLIKFLPFTNFKILGHPIEIHKKGLVFIFNMQDDKLILGQQILIQKDNNFLFSRINEIKFNNENVESAQNGQFGFLIDKNLKESDIIWISK